MQEVDFYLGVDHAGMHGLNEELIRHRGRERKVECTLCSVKCESVVHVLWECPAYGSCI